MNIRVGHNRLWVTLLVIVLLLGVLPVSRVSAGLEGCSTSVTPTTVEAGTTTAFTFNIVNNASSSIEWVKIAAPSGGLFSVQSGSANHWTVSTSTNDATFTNWSLPPVRNQNFVVQAAAASGTSGNGDWTVMASDDPAGAGAINCSGSTNVQVNPSSIVISNVRITGLTDTSVTILWDSSAPGTSHVDYGTDTSYGSSPPDDNNLVTSHSMNLTGLSPDTGYHYRVVSSTAGGAHTATSDDNTFLTPAPTESTTSGSTSSTATKSRVLPPLTHGVPLLAKPIENTPPIIALTTSIPKVVKSVPTISGVASDNTAIAEIEYSTDGGQNWLPTNQTTGLGTQHASFSFTPPELAEGDYALLARAIDTSGNIGLTPVQTLVIDRLPPIVGGNVLSLGPQILAPDQKGTIASLVGLNQKITLSAIGGPTSIVLNAVPNGSQGKAQNFSLTESAETGLWSGFVSFSNAGNYTLIANAVDGAGNKTSRTLNAFSVSSPARTVDAATGKPLSSTVTLYYQAPDTNNWVVWDGASYGQKNPQVSNKQGNFELLLPPGKYYLKATAPQHHPVYSSIFETKDSEPLTTTLALKPQHGLSLGSLHVWWPNLSLAAQTVKLDQQNRLITMRNSGQGSLVGRQVPEFSLVDTNGVMEHSADLLGKPTVITFAATWAPTTAEQLGALADLQTNQAFNVVPVALQENLARAQAYTGIAGLNLRWLVDPDSTTTTSYSTQSLPTHYFVDRKGVVRQVVVGILTKQELLTILEGL